MGREITKLGHEIKLIPAQHVTPFVRGNKNDHNDAFAIVEASQRAHIRFVPIKTEYQQEICCLHRIRERLVKNKTALSNQARGLFSEFGIVFSGGHKALTETLAQVMNDPKYSNNLQSIATDFLSEYELIVSRIKKIERQLNAFSNSCESGKILLSIPGIGPINASALLAAIDKGQAFNNPKEFAVWLGLTPKQHASGNSNKMGGITKRGDCYLRKQLVHGARALVCRAASKKDVLSTWANNLRKRKPFNQVAVAMAHRLARLVWILLNRQECYCEVKAQRAA